MIKKTLLLGLIIALSLSFSLPATAAYEDYLGTVVKTENGSTLYYIDAEGNRYIFPNEKVYKSWFADFSDVRIIAPTELNQYQLKENVRYRPGVVLVKITESQRVYAVGLNGLLRWVKNENLARLLYGDHWSDLIDDIPVVLFHNYQIGSDIDDEGDYDPEQEVDDVPNIERNHGLAIKLINRIRLADTIKCKVRSEIEIDRGNRTKAILKRVCQYDSDDDQDNDKKITVCHITSSAANTTNTLRISRSALAAHLAHGDTIGRCDNDQDDDDDSPDTTPPVINNIVTETLTNRTTIQWRTNEATNGKVVYATNPINTATSTKSQNSLFINSTIHGVSLYDLTASTTYYYLIVAEDTSGNKATSTQQTFETKYQDPHDSERVADVKQIQTALELYFNDTDAYPNGINLAIGAGTGINDCSGQECDTISLNNGIAATSSGTTYMALIPADPVGGPECTASATSSCHFSYSVTDVGGGINNGYELLFFLQGETGSLERGINCSTEAGIDSSCVH